jgi:hypothetical protein
MTNVTEFPQSKITPATGGRLECLKRLAEVAQTLPNIIDSEISGVRDGNGYWEGSDALHGTISGMWEALKEIEAIDVCPRCGMTAQHHAACQSNGGPLTSLTNKQVREVMDSEKTHLFPF